MDQGNDIQRLDEERIRELLADVEAGRTSAIALFQQHGVDAATLNRWRKAHAASPPEPEKAVSPVAPCADLQANDEPPPVQPSTARRPSRTRPGLRRSEQERRAILEEWNAGAAPAAVCAKHRLDPTTLYRWRKRYGAGPVAALDNISVPPRAREATADLRAAREPSGSSRRRRPPSALASGRQRHPRARSGNSTTRARPGSARPIAKISRALATEIEKTIREHLRLLADAIEVAVREEMRGFLLERLGVEAT